MNRLRENFSKYYQPCKLSFQEKKDTFTYLNISSKETQDNLKSMIMQSISGTEISLLNLQDELSQLLIEYY